MTDPVRILGLMGSGELSPTMVKVHRDILQRLGRPPQRAVFLDTPFRFQENADELAARAATYFSESLNTVLEVPPGRTPTTSIPNRGASADASLTGAGHPFSNERLTTMLREARYIFSGPGSPTYALRTWSGTVVPGLIEEKLARGGAVTFASAAALTLGAFTVPVYEIYKVGEDPHWLPGLDVLSPFGLNAAVVPHFNNAEGGTHDTRFCYLGEHRLATMEEMLPDETFVLGIDEHTSLVVDLGTGHATVGGLGVITVRKHGHSVVFRTGATLTLDAIVDAATSGARHPTARLAPDAPPRGEAPVGNGASPLIEIVLQTEETFDEAVRAGDAVGAARTILDLESEIHAWSTDIPQQDELDRARASLRAMIDKLGELAVNGLRDPREVLGPFVETLIAQRQDARNASRFSEADKLRHRLSSLGIELRDGPDATEWELVASP